MLLITKDLQTIFYYSPYFSVFSLVKTWIDLFFVFGFRLQHLLLHQFSGFRKMWPFTIVFDQSQVFLVKDKD